MWVFSSVWSLARKRPGILRPLAGLPGPSALSALIDIVYPQGRPISVATLAY
jgi:hypothetical protein